MSKKETIYKVVKNNYDFREYIYNKNFFMKIWGVMFRSVQYDLFTQAFLEGINLLLKREMKLSDYDDIYDKRSKKIMRITYRIIGKVYSMLKAWETQKIYKNAQKRK